MYCGKEIGAFRLLRDSEFCSLAHRKKYGERLGKALHNIAEPEPAPAGIAGFLVQMPLQPGNTGSILVSWHTDPRLTGIRTGAQWTLTIDTTDAKESSPVVECPPVECPPQIERWMAAPPAEPVAAFVQTSAATMPAYTPRVPRHLVNQGANALAACGYWMPTPASEPVTAFVRTSSALAPVALLRARRPAAELTLNRTPHAPAVCDRGIPAPGPEPVAAFVQTSAALIPAALLRLPIFVVELALDDAPHTPAACEHWMPAAAPEPVAAWVQTSTALAPAAVLRLPRLAAELDATPFLDALDTPGMCERWMPGPGPEPVAAFLQSSAVLVRAHRLRIPRLAARLESASIAEPAGVAEAPAPEPVAAFVQAVAVLNPAYAEGALRLDFGMEPAAQLDARPVSCNLWMSGEATVATCGATIDAPQPVYIPSVAQTDTAVRIPAAEFTAELEPLPTADELFEPPEMCRQWMPAPGADPVFSYLRASSAPAVTLRKALELPAFAASIASPYVPGITWSRSIPDPEPVMAPSRHATGKTPLVLLRPEAAIVLPASSQATQGLFAAAKPTAPPDAPEAVESLLVAAQATVPLSIKHAPSRSAELEAPPAVVEPAPELCNPVAGPAPAALESLLVASVAAAMVPLIPVRTLRFAMAAGREGTLPSFNARQLAPSVRKSRAAASRLVAPQPIATLVVSSPANMRQPLDSALPRPGLVPIEFHTHSLRSSPVARSEWKLARPTLVPPKFQLRLVPEKLEDPIAQQKAVRKEPEVVKILNMPAAKRPPTVLMVFGRVAAGFLLVASLWFGITNVRGDRQLAAIREVPSSAPALSAANSANPGKAPNGAPVRPAAKGAAAWVKQAIAGRAALKVAENFHGMENWDIEAKAKTSGWSRHPDGYMNTGALALFRPTLKFNDYRMEFFGQIESKSIGWTVRATDPNNYHAMKLTVIEAGLRPFVALVQYNVVNGKSGHRTQTPLNVMVHNNRPLQFAVDVRGNRFVTSINGEEVDSFIDNTLASGGVGFFSEAGERARLYWMKFTRNDDWLGHVCALLAEEAGAARAAALQKPGLPGSAPVPGLPQDSYGAMLPAVWIGLPYLRATRKTRFFKTWRSEPWNT